MAAALAPRLIACAWPKGGLLPARSLTFSVDAAGADGGGESCCELSPVPPGGLRTRPSIPTSLSSQQAHAVLRMDFTRQDYLRDPATGLAKLRAAGPVVEVRIPIVGKTWITTTSDLAGRVLKDSETFTMRRNGRVAGLRWWMPGWIRTLAVSMLTMDEPDHTRLRSIVDEAFRRRAILDMEPRIFAIADELAADLFADGSPADLVERYARKLPLSVICELLGLPRADRPRFIAWANSLTRLTGMVSFLRMIAGLTR